MTPLLVYVAGPLGPESSWDANVRAALTAANAVMDAGHDVIVPHLSVHLHRLRARTYERWMEMDLRILRRCDAVLRVSGHSPGADRECELARRLGIPVVESVADLAGLHPLHDREHCTHCASIHLENEHELIEVREELADAKARSAKGEAVIAVDLFAGAGGWTTGATQAGVRVAAAVNHWPLAVETHRANHPETEHRCQDVGLMDPRDLPAHDLLLASPACQGHSRARGTDKPHHDASRATAWAVIDVAEVTRPRLIAVENVPEFRDWPLFPLWRQALERLGYGVSEQVLCASSFGVPQERRRLFILGVRGRAAPEVRPQGVAARAVGDVIEWGRGDWTPVVRAGRAEATLRRVAAGRARFGSRFVMPYYGSGSGETGRSIARPLGTVTTVARWAAVDGDRMRMLSVRECLRVQGFPKSYRLLGTQRDQHKLIGNAVAPPVAAAVVRHLAEAV